MAVFWGCTIPARLPSIEKATRLVLQDLGLDSRELPGFTCCPEGTLVKAHDRGAFYLTAARNLAIAGRTGLDLLTPCSGCYSTFKETQSHMGADTRARGAVVSRLAAEDLSWLEGLRVLHLAEWLADVLGAAAIARGVVRSLAGMRLAVHHGCHLLRPQPAVCWDDAIRPTKLEEIVQALGARVVDYPSKMLCCGGALDRCGEREGSLAFARRKLHDLEAAAVDALVVACPSCFQQFDLNQAALQRAHEDVNVPVLYLSELIALAYGHAAAEIGLTLHRVSVDPFLSRWEQRLAGRAAAAESFDLALLEKCDACRACRDDCPVGKIDPAFQPNEIVAAILDGDLEGALAGGQAWKCLECYTCLELCPSRIGLAETMRIVKEHAVMREGQPVSVGQAFQLFLQDAVLGKPRDSARGKLGLPSLPPNGAQSLKRLLTGEATGEAMAGDAAACNAACDTAATEVQQ
jgi:heterodisulfide reductase subunit B